MGQAVVRIEGFPPTGGIHENDAIVRDALPGWPLSTICHIQAKPAHGGPAVKGTGFVIAGDLILTAAHNVASDYFDGEAPQRVRIYLGWSETNFGKRYTVEDTFYDLLIHDAYPDNPERDIAIIRLGQGIGHVAGALGLEAADDDRLVGASSPDEWLLNGFPHGGPLESYSGHISNLTPWAFRHTADDTEGGVSGGPIWAYLGDMPMAVGVHYFSDDLSDTDACRVTENDIDWILSVIEEHPPDR